MSRVSTGMIWSFFERFSTQGIGFVLSVIIARIVAPEVYGLIAIVQVFISFAQVFIDSGFGNALIQKKYRTDDDFYTVFIFNLVVSAILYIIFFFCAPLISDFYNEPRLTQITRLVSLTLLISAFCIVQRTKLTIQLDFKRQAVASFSATLISGAVGVIMAYRGFGVWALVTQQLIMQIVQAIVLAIVSKWRPRFVFDFDSFKQMFSFGSKLLVNNLITSVYINIANIFIGKWYSPASLAFYNRGFTLSQIISTNIEGVLQRIIYPITCEAQDDKEKLIKCYQKYLHLSHFIILPILTMMCILATPLISVLLTDSWLPAAEYVVLFCINFMFYAWTDQSGSLTNAIGRSDMNLKGTFIKRPIAFLLLFISLGKGVKAICIATIISSIIELIVNIGICNKVIGMKVWEHIKPQLDLFCVNILMGIIVYFVSLLFCSMKLKLFISGIIGGIVYIILSFIFKLPERRLILFLFNRSTSAISNVR